MRLQGPPHGCDQAGQKLFLFNTSKKKNKRKTVGKNYGTARIKSVRKFRNSNRLFSATPSGNHPYKIRANLIPSKNPISFRIFRVRFWNSMLLGDLGHVYPYVQCCRARDKHLAIVEVIGHRRVSGTGRNGRKPSVSGWGGGGGEVVSVNGLLTGSSNTASIQYPKKKKKSVLYSFSKIWDLG